MKSSSTTVREVANYLNVETKLIYRLAQNGKPPDFQLVGTWRFKYEDIDPWNEEQKQAARRKVGK